jgi:anti-sigma factor RsiW
LPAALAGGLTCRRLWCVPPISRRFRGRRHTADHVSCQDVVELVTDYLDKALPPDEAALFEQDINFCDGCIWYVEQIKATGAALGEIREGEISPATKDRLLTAFRNWRA